MSGAKTQLYTLFSSTLLLVVIVWLGPLLEPLPMCILACIVIVSLKSLFMQCTELPKLWKLSKFDFAIWLASCVSTVVTDVTTGLLISVVFVLITIVLREQWPKAYNLATTPGRTVFKPASCYKGLTKLPDNLEILNVELSPNGDNYKPLAQNDDKVAPQKTLIIDCTAIAYVDTMGVEAFKEIYNDSKKLNVLLLFADLNESVYETLLNINFIPGTIPKDRFYPTLEEALKYAMEPAVLGDGVCKQ
uniref:STAS domain-containing protein n=2 Tax=Steinernema glaseri TaxID=37863 RepID=A0A1I8A2W2_9BILA